MQIKIYKDYQALSATVADEIIELVKNKPDAVLCMASGSTPLLTCTLTVEKSVKNNIDFSRVTFIGLDEWVGVPPQNDGSCHWFFQNHLLQALKIPAAQIHLFDAMASNLNEECSKMDKIISEKGGIDLMIVGIGMNGHIGFNEPGISFDKRSHIINLDPMTLSIGKKYFNSPVALSKGITLGLQHLMESKKVILMANGNKKADVIRRTIEETVHTYFPASIMQMHLQSVIMIDEEAAFKLKDETK